VFKSLLLASIVHALALFALIFSFEWNIDVEAEPVQIIQATTVDESKIAKQIEKLKKIESKKKRDEDLRLAKLAKEAQSARRDREKEQQRLLDLQKKREQIQQKQMQLETDRRKEKQRLDELKQRNAEAKKEQQNLARTRAEKEREAKREHELQRRQQEIDDLQKQMEEELAARVAAEEPVPPPIDDPNLKLAETEIEKFKAKVVREVSRNWIKPPGLRIEQVKDLKCELIVRLMPTGQVQYVNFIQDCGDSRFQNSVEAAVKKAEPYEFPSDIFDKVRDIKFIFTPPQESS